MRRLFFCLAAALALRPGPVQGAGLYEREKAWWKGDLSLDLAGSDMAGYGLSRPLSNGFLLEGGLPGKLNLETSLEGLLTSDLRPHGAEPRFDLIQGQITLRQGPLKLSLGRVFMSGGLPLGYQDGGLLEARVLKRWGFRLLGGAPSRDRGNFGRGKTWGGGIFHRGKAWGGALNADLGYVIQSGQARVWTGSEVELVPYIRKEEGGGVVSWSSYATGVSAILRYDLLYLRLNELRLSAHRRCRSRNTARAEVRLRGSNLPGDSIFATFAGAGKTWWDASAGLDHVFKGWLLRADAGGNPGLSRYWGEAGLESSPFSGIRRGEGLSCRWGLAFKEEASPGSHAFRVKPRVDAELGSLGTLELHVSAGSLGLPGRPSSTSFGCWALGASFSRRLGRGECRLSMESQAWISARPDQRADLELSLPLDRGGDGWRKP